ncbi:MAG: hypothetical protein M3347_08495 [Armatimonadota bacterium]|nr:hypothetical protein [Armatimonadota bacterium]
MEREAVAAIMRVLNESGAQYLVAGGLAVIAHGYFRFTADVDLIVVLTPENLRKIGAALEPLSYRPRLPEPLEKLGDAATRQRWIEEKNMVVFSLVSAQHPLTIIDLFVEEPFDFDEAHARVAWQEVVPGLRAPFVAYEDLLDLKQKAGRPQDLLDIYELQSRREPP